MYKLIIMKLQRNQKYSLLPIKRLLIVVLLFGAGLQVQAQMNKIIGKVTFNNGKPAIGVTVSVASLDQIAISDLSGNFTLAGLPTGLVQITFTSLEVEELNMEVQVKHLESKLNVTLKPSQANNLHEVVIEGSTKKRKIETSGFAVSVIETKEASLRNLTTNELLDRAVGVRVRQNGGEGSPIEYNLNGMSGNAIGLFLDGIEMSTYGSSFNMNNIPPSMIERIEIYKGVLPSHLSGNYVGGAINVIMKKDVGANNINVAVSYGSFNTYRADMGALYRNRKNGLTARASGFYSHSDNNYEMWGKFSKYTLPGGKIIRNYRTKRPNDIFDTFGGRFELGFTDVKWADQVFIGYNLSDAYKEIPHGITMTKPYFGRFNEYQAHVFSLNYNKRDLWVDGLALNVNAVHSKRSTYLEDTVSLKYNWDGSLLVKNSEGKPQNYDYSPGKGQQGDAVMSNIDRAISNIRTNIAYTIVSGHRISLNYKFEKTGREDQDLLIPERNKWITQNEITTNIWAVNYEAETLNRRLRTNVFGKFAIYQSNQKSPVSETDGVLLYHNSSTKRDNKGFGGTLSYEAITGGFLIVSAEKSFIMPTERHIYGEAEHNLLANPYILPEMMVNYNLGARYNLSVSDKHRFSFYGNGFWRNGYDKIILQTIMDPVVDGRENQVEDIQVTQFDNLSRTQSIGFEAEINYVYNDKLNAILNFSKFNSLFKVKQDERGSPHSLYNKQIPNEPFFTANASIQYRFNNIIQRSSALDVYYNAGYVAPFRTIWMESEWFTTPTQFAHDIGASYRFPNVNLVASIDCKNIFNAEVYDNFGVQKPGRAIYLKLNFMINKNK